jgi:fumarylacetoacetase
MVYNGRTSSLMISGTPVTRPCGVVHTGDPSNPYKFLPTSKLDFELEMGVFLCRPLPRGERLTATSAKEHIFGLVILNDWSSRDIQVFEMPPLGPFHAKGFGTSISPWIITTEALELVESSRAVPQQPAPLPHLAWTGDESEATFDIELAVTINREKFSSLISRQYNNGYRRWKVNYSRKEQSE